MIIAGLYINRFRFRKGVSFILLVIISNYVNGQPPQTSVIEHDSLVHNRTADSLAHQKDLADIFNTIVKRHGKQGPDNTLEKPGKLFFSFAPAAGYTLEGGPIAVVTVNASFYSGAPATTNLSVFTFGGEYSLHNQLIIPVISDIWSNNNKYDWLGDWRYYSYPSTTYGLGSNTSLASTDKTYYSYVKVYQEVLRHLSSSYYAGLGYNLDDHYGIKDYGDETDFQQYSSEYNNGATKTISSGPIAHLLYDSRKNSNNPKDALLVSILFRTNFTFLGSTQNWQYLQLEIRKYFKLSSRSVLALWSWNEFTSGPAPYFDLPANQWDTYSNTGRGYIQGFYKGTNLVYLEAEYRFGLTSNGLLGGVVFSNAGSATQWPSNKFEYIDPAEGVGLRVKLNKYSDVNLCIDYAVGLDGSHGFFFNLGEVF